MHSRSRHDKARRKLAGLFGAAFAMSLAGVSATRVDAAGTQVSGTLVLQITLYPNSALASGTISITPRYDLENSTNEPAVFYGATTSVKVVGGKATTTLNIPYTFLVPSTGYTLSISVIASGQPNAALSDETFFYRYIAVPANGATTTLAFTGAI